MKAKLITLRAALFLLLLALHAAATEVCSSSFTSFINGPIVQICAIASVAAVLLIVFGYFLGQVTSNPKVSVWAKSEILQIFMSVASVALLIFMMNSFCAIRMSDVASIFGIPVRAAYSGSVYSAAEAYLSNTLVFSHDALEVVRYHLEGYTVLTQISLFVCDLRVGSIGWGCLFSWSGEQSQPMGSYSAAMGALNLFFNSTLVAYMTTLNFLFILLFIFRGFVLFLLPFAIFMRSMPYMRAFGSLLISVALSFMVIYPLLLAIFGMTADILLNEPVNVAQFKDESTFPENAGAGGVAWTTGISTLAEIATSVTGGLVGTMSDYYENQWFPNGENVAGAIAFAAYAFIAGVFLPTAALLATIASVNYLARIYGEEIDLSRILQMV